jgi:hypothetical protein
MFGISPLGWLHTLGSLPAIPLAIYMFARYGRIVPRTGKTGTRHSPRQPIFLLNDVAGRASAPECNVGLLK